MSISDLKVIVHAHKAPIEMIFVIVVFMVIVIIIVIVIRIWIFNVHAQYVQHDNGARVL